MATAQSPLARQPDKLDYASPTQFKFNINQLPKVEFFTTAANVPGISSADVIMNTPFKSIPSMGTNLTYENLSITFICDEYLENYKQLHDWLIAIGFPKNREQLSTFRGNTSNSPISTQGTSQDIGDIQPSTAARGMFSDATLTILSNKNNPIAEVRFQDLYPLSISALEFNQNATDVEYLTVSAEFVYKIYEIHSL